MAATTPLTSTEPAVGVVVPAMIFKRVDLPAPFSPMMPTAVPGSTPNVTSSRARKSRWRLGLPIRRLMRSPGAA